MLRAKGDTPNITENFCDDRKVSGIKEVRAIEDERISKKDLLAAYGISYGALYRWKRMKLIPEEWFIKMATPTGQETFFPRQLICERMQLILEARDSVSLEELAVRLGGKAAAQPTLVLDTPMGKRRLRPEEILSATVECGTKITDVTAALKALFASAGVTEAPTEQEPSEK